ncbi:CPBP family intramembrane metalloprotease domain-containing protein, partial [Fischerella thermalis CCMEE 5196]
MFFYSILLAVWKSSLYNWQSFWENAPSLVVVMAFFLAWAGCWFPIAALEAVFLNWKPNQPLKSEQKIP